MSQNGLDLVDQQHREESERQRQKKEKERALVEAMFEQALARRLEEEECGRGLADAERPKGIQHTELQEAKPSEALAAEWNTYCRAVGRLLSEGQEGRHVLIKGQEIISTFDTSDAAYREGLKRFLGQPFFVHPIRAEEPYLRIRGINYPWPNSHSR